jgi:thioredoxin-dependent peroxiredoxin
VEVEFFPSFSTFLPGYIMRVFYSAGYQVFGISADTPKVQASWREKHDLPFTLLCDKSKEALRALGFVEGDKIKRSHVIVGPGGVIESVAVGVTPGGSVESATDFCVDGNDEEE